MLGKVFIGLSRLFIIISTMRLRACCIHHLLSLYHCIVITVKCAQMMWFRGEMMVSCLLLPSTAAAPFVSSYGSCSNCARCARIILVPLQ